MNKLEQAVKNYDSAIDEYYADGFYPGVQEQKEINDLQYEVIKEARNFIKEKEVLEQQIKHYKENRDELLKSNVKMKRTLVIINEKNVNISLLKNSPTIDYYNYHVSDWRKLIQEEFNLLKEVLLK